MNTPTTPSGKWLLEVLRAHPRGVPLDAPAISVANLVAACLPAIEAEARSLSAESWSEDAEGYVVAPLVNRGTLDAD